MGKSKRKLTQHKTSGKGKRWRKGHSSSSNPTTSKFREAAKNRFFNQNTGPSALTEAALAKHNEDGTGGNEGERMSDITSQTDRLSLTAKTFNTWASNWTECTNTSFSRVHRYWQSNSAFHKEILAILAAVTEVIKAQGGKETETEYLGALMTALETSDNEQSLAAISYLISLVIKRVPMAVLRSKFSELAKKLLDYLGKHADGQSTSLLKSLITTLASLLRLQEQMVWNNSSTLQVYSGLLTFIVHSKPKVRKAAHRAICVILKGSVFMSEGDCPPHHPAASSTAKYCVQQIEECGGKGEALATLHTLALLRDILGWFPQHSLKSACETILRVMTLSNLMVTACCMQTLHGMFLSQPAASRLPAELNAQIITALYEYQPSVSDVQPMRAWLAVMEEGHVNLGRLQEKLCLSHLPRLVSAAMGCLLSDRIEVAETSAEVIKSLVTKCLSPAADNLASLVESSGVSPTPLQKIQQALEKGLGYQYHACWGLILQIFSVYYSALGKHCGKIMGKSLETIAELRESHKFAYKGELDHAVGCAIRTMGPQRVLEAIPLNITGDGDSPDFPRSWLLPVLRENVQDTELGYFTSYFLPLAAKFKQKVDEMTEIGHSIQAKSYEALQRQIWSLLPRFCIRPTDLQQAFPGLAKVLGVALNDRPHLRMDILSSLRKLILQNVDNDSARSVLSRFAKNYLPILFNLFTDASQTAGEGVKPAVLETIKVYLQIADSQLVNSMLVKCLTKTEEEGLEKMTNYNLLDLSIAMVPYTDQAGVGNLYSLAKSHLNSIDKTLQKKCYRMLEEICSGKSVQCQEFVRGNVSDLKEILLQSLSSSGPSSKAPRLKCLVHVFRCLETGNEDFLLSVVPEAILCTKEIGERARLAGYSLLVEMAATLTRWSDKPQLEVLEQYFELLLPGLAGEHHMISATLLALSRLLYKFKDSVSDRLLDVLLENCCVLLESRQRDVLKSTLALIRVILASFTDLRLAHYLEKLVSSLVSLKEENRRHFRFDAKQIFVRLTRKFGYETIYNMVPESYKKVLVNIRKTQERAKKKSKERDIEKDEDEAKPSHPVESIEELLRDTDSEPEDDNEKPKKMTKKANKQQRQKGDAWLKEDDQAEIMDFLDSSAAKRVMATKPVPKEKESKKSADFKTTPDGRLIITGDKESDKGDSEDEDGLQDLLDAFESHRKQKGRKRKMSMDVDEDEGVSTTKYKAGGSGIHRPLGKPTKSSQKRDGTSSREIGADYKAKKAGGDIKKKGQPDPYAYVPLQMSNLNRRKQAKLKGQFSGFVRGAKKGAAKGTKAKQKSRH